MSAFIGTVNGPRHNSPKPAVKVWCSLGGIEIGVHGSSFEEMTMLDPIGARVLAALLVQASKEAERMRARADIEDSLLEHEGEKA